MRAESDIEWASHLITSRGAYRHHGVYVGDGRVIQYTGYSSGIRRRPVEEVSLGVFAGGRPVQVLHRGASRYSPIEVIERARSRLGEDRYRILTNNCEHFCEWCFCGVARSFQVEAMRYGLLRVVSQVRGWRPRVVRRARPACHTCPNLPPAPHG
jgi:hypothetical protein